MKTAAWFILYVTVVVGAIFVSVSLPRSFHPEFNLISAPQE